MSNKSPIDKVRTILIICCFLVFIIYFAYRGNNWPMNIQTLEIAASLIVILAHLGLLAFIKHDNETNISIIIGLFLGLLWTIEISINNFVHPGLPTRDVIDNIFWLLIALGILTISSVKAYQSGKFVEGVEAGFWSGLISGTIACLSALVLIVFGMKLIVGDQLNIQEWAHIDHITRSSGMATYFAYQTLAGAILHLLVLGTVMGVLLGAIGGTIGKTVALTTKKLFPFKY